jgi:hypothetical protein
MDELRCNPWMGAFKDPGEKGEGLFAPSRTETPFAGAKNQEKKSKSSVQNSVFSNRTCFCGNPETA